ncbi:hypothetical protein KSP35_03935 [Aquihabitans sp. G128]|uniref:hypothetical protein n=1 Tax=Aquihabitans sp. G128 TaxID=2849779 RepID=UPI001C226C92|nr:hypothetical protein [Aquihabitans sp. G128]QXC61980.1 hypothetical protein KSP35_03935 [Aquihabitans sp. G128]
MSAKRIIGTFGAAALLVLGSGCGKVAEKAAEKATEKAIEDQSGGDAKVDIDGGKVKVSDGDGNTYETGDDGSVKISGDDGSTSFTSGEGTELPKGWPDDLAPPKGTKIETATESDGSLTVSGSLDAPVKAVYDGIKAQLQDGGYELTGDTYTSAEGSGYGSLTATKGQKDVSVSVTGGGSDGSDGSVVIMSVIPKG